MGRHLRLYNVLFPMWLFYLFPTVMWLIILPANFLVDSLVLILAARRLGIPSSRDLWKHSIVRIWGLGFLSDLLGGGLTLAIQLALDAAGLHWDTFLFPGVTLISIPGVILAGFCIYRLNLRFSFKDSALQEEQRRRLCLALGIFTAPYAMLIPLYG